MKITASKDSNSVPSLITVSSADGVTIIPVQADPVNHGLKSSDGTTGSDLGPDHALKDQNDISTILAVSSTDGVTPVAVYSNSSGQILIDSM